jgi:hypothetical protein
LRNVVDHNARDLRAGLAGNVELHNLGLAHGQGTEIQDDQAGDGPCAIKDGHLKAGLFQG